MCWLIFAGVRGYRGDPATAFRLRGYVAESSRNPACEQMDVPGVVAISDGDCACSFYIPTQRYVGENTQLMRARYRRKGWPDGRVERVVKARCAATEKQTTRQAERDKFLSLIEQLVESSAEVSLLAHFFEGSFDEPFPVRDRRKLTIAEFLGNGGTFQEDEVTLISR